MHYFPRLDGVRALAVGGVLVAHSLWQIPGIEAAKLGHLGVRVFFVLSGFLITRILLDYRDRMTVREAAATFYWRRFLRLGPPFYLAILVSAAIGIGNMRADWPFHALYLSNFLLAWNGPHRPLGHLWSLAVEEQFYLLWFVVVVWLPRRWLMPSIIGGILLAPLFRYVSTGWVAWPAVLPPAVVDCLAFGCLIGVASLRHPKLYAAFADWRLFWLASAGLVALFFYPNSVVYGTVAGLFGASLIALAACPSMTKLDWLCIAPLRDMGKISYGIYLYHGFLPLFAPGAHIHPLVYAWLSIILAAISWVLLERPILRLKDLKPIWLRPKAAS